MSDKNNVWINPKTGQSIEADMVLKRVGREDFEIVYLASLFNLLERLGGKRYQIFKYIIQNKNYENITLITTYELAKKLKVSRTTVQETINLLKNAGVIKTRPGIIILNPRLMNRGTMQKELYLIQKFEMFDEKENSFKNSTYKSDGVDIEQNNFFDTI